MTEIRTIRQGTYRVTPVYVDGTADLRAWLLAQAHAHALTTLLAHADDGVIWGRVHDGRMLIAREVLTQHNFPDLRWLTLQQARLFGPTAELLLWQTDAGPQARLVQEGTGTPCEFYDERQMLWGTERVTAEHGFTLVRDGAQGFFHAPPVEADARAFVGKKWRPLRLHVRHYLTLADDGLLKVTLSSLVGLSVEYKGGRQ